MRVYMGADHAGYELKVHLAGHLAGHGYVVVDVGAARFEPDDDYPAYCLHTGRRVVDDPGSLGVVIGGSGNGEQIAANKVPGVRAALAWSEETARLGREHNDAHVVAVGARMHPPEDAARFVDVFLATAFTGGERHARRLRLLADYEAGH
jgi:ribose 5-phosphate isomerase B